MRDICHKIASTICKDIEVEGKSFFNFYAISTPIEWIDDDTSSKEVEDRNQIMNITRDTMSI